MPIALRAATFPQLSDGTDHYYKLYSYRATRVLKDNGVDKKAVFVSYIDEDATSWKFVPTNTTHDNSPGFKIVSKSGRELKYHDNLESTDNRFGTVAADGGSTFIFKEFSGNAGFQLYCTEKSQFINHTGDEIGAYGNGNDAGNRFNAITSYSDLFEGIPALSTAGDTTWYHLKFSQSGKAITANGINEKVIQQALDAKEDQLFRLEVAGDNFRVISKIDNMELKFDGNRKIILVAAGGGDVFSFAVHQKSPLEWMLSDQNDTWKDGINNNGGTEAGLANIGNHDGNGLKFIDYWVESAAKLLSTSAAPKWYHVQLLNGNTIIASTGENQNVTREALKVREEQLFRLEGSTSALKVISKINDMEFKLVDGKIQLVDKGSGELFSLADHPNSPAEWMLCYNDATDGNKFLNPQDNETVGLYGGENDNKLKFIDDLSADAPKLSTPGDTTWYHLQFVENNNAITANGLNQNAIQQPLAANDKQLFRLEGSYNVGFKVISKINNMEFEHSGDWITLAENGGDLFSFAFENNDPAKRMLKDDTKGSSGNIYINNNGNTQAGLYSSGNGNHLNFIDDNEYIAANYAGAPKLSTSDDPTWYHLQFGNGGTKIAANGENQKVVLQSSLEVNENQQFRLEGSYGGLKIISRADNMELKFSANDDNKFILVSSGGGDAFTLAVYDNNSPEEWLLRHVESNEFLNPNGGVIHYSGKNESRLKFIDDQTAGAPKLNEWYYIQLMDNSNALAADGENNKVVQQALEAKDEQLFKMVGKHGNFKVVSKINSMELKFATDGDNKDKFILVAVGSGDSFSFARHPNSPAEWILKDNNKPDNNFLNPQNPYVGLWGGYDRNNLKFITEYELYTGAPKLSSIGDTTWYHLYFPRNYYAITANGAGSQVDGQALGPKNSQLFRLEGNSYGSFKVISKIGNLEFKSNESNHIILAAGGSGDMFSLASHSNSPEVWMLKHDGLFINDNGFFLYNVMNDEGNCVKFIEDADYTAALYAAAPALSTAADPKWYYIRSPRITVDDNDNADVIMHKGMNTNVHREKLAEGNKDAESQLFRFEGSYDEGVKVVGKDGGALQYYAGVNKFYMVEGGSSTFRFIPTPNTNSDYGSGKWGMLYKEPTVVPIAPSGDGNNTTPFNPPWKNSEKTIPFGGNAYVTSGIGGVTAAGITDWVDDETVYSTYFRVNTSGDLSLSLWYVSDGESTVKVTVGPAPADGVTFTGTEEYTVTLPKPQASQNGDTVVSICTLPNCEVGYLRVDLQGVSKTGEFYAIPQALGVSGDASNNMNYYSRTGRRNSASVHLRYDISNPDQAEWFYNEVTIPEGMDHSATYAMVNGFKEGYSGIQPSRENGTVRVLFSVWAPVDTDDPNEIPLKDRVSCLAIGSDVCYQMFGGEGAGTQTFATVAGWEAGKTYKFLVRVCPATKFGFNDYVAADHVAYFFDPATEEWKLIAHLRRPKPTNGWTSYHDASSFLENFWGDSGNLLRKAVYGNQWIRLKSGEWEEVTKATFVTDGTGNDGERLDFKGAVDGNKFYLQNGGFFNDYVAPNTPLMRSATGAEPSIDFDALELLRLEGTTRVTQGEIKGGACN